ncbi:MAG: hypothetical protein Q4F66_03350 [Clostridium sp.]|nr:hypothetical protein [Clostridium sp.]
MPFKIACKDIKTEEQPADEAVSTAKEFLMEDEIDIHRATSNRDSIRIKQQLFSDINDYIARNYEDDKSRIKANKKDVELKSLDDRDRVKNSLVFFSKVEKSDSIWNEIFPSNEANSEADSKGFTVRKLEDLINNLDETFSEMVLRLIDEKGYTDVEVYKRANIDRKLFSKIRNNKNYNPTKKTVIALAIGMKLSLDESVDLLQKAGYSFSNSSKFDVIMKYFFEKREYDLFTINEALLCFEQPMLST